MKSTNQHYPYVTNTLASQNCAKRKTYTHNIQKAQKSSIQKSKKKSGRNGQRRPCLLNTNDASNESTPHHPGIPSDQKTTNNIKHTYMHTL